MRNSIIIMLFAFIIAGCGKSKFESKPVLEFKDVNTTELHRQQLIRFTLGFTDKDGDISDSVFIQKIVADCPATSFNQWFPMPSVPPTSDMKGQIVLTLGYNVSGYSDILGPQCQQDDKAIFRFVLKDEKGNVSDTVSSPIITIFQ
ncbi:MAG: hypothetical protein J0H55_00355 [Chitinophagaceae bacterium]|nr:hypothetical protein [Chitinophagaceae bacterium]